MSSTQRVGRIPVALALVAYGTVLLADALNVTTGATDTALRLWPVLLIACGLEYLVRTLLAERRTVGPDGATAGVAPLRFDFGGAFFLALVILLGSGVTSVANWVQSSAVPWGDPTVYRSESRAVPAAGVREVIVSAGVGRIEVQPAVRSGEIGVDARLAARSPAALDRIELRVTPGETVRVGVEMPPTAGGGADFVVYVPRGIRVRAETGAGSLRVTGHEGDLELSTRVGRIEVEGAVGNLQASSGSGSIRLQANRGPATVRTSIGRIDVKNVTGALQLESGSGSISVDEYRGGGLSAVTNVGTVSVATTTPPEGDLRLRSHSGSITLAVPASSRVAISARTRTGSVALPGAAPTNRVGPAQDGHLTLGDGQYAVELETDVGSISVNLLGNLR